MYQLALTAEDKWPRESAIKSVPKWTEQTPNESKPLSDEEKDRAQLMVEDARFTKTVLLTNFDARLHSLMPPTGYAALWHKDSTFVSRVFDRNIFRGVSYVHLARKRAPASFDALEADLNALLGDASPVPLVSRDQGDDWVCSLGEGGWVGMYTRQDNHKAPCVAVVVAGLDPASYETFRKEMETMHRKVSVEEAYGRLEFWRTAAKRNRKRILATFIRASSGDQPLDTTKNRFVELNRSLYKSRSEQRIEAIGLFKNPALRIPEWFVFPSVSPRGCNFDDVEPGYGVQVHHTREEKYPFEVEVEVDVVLDDFVSFREQEYVRLAGCSDARQSHVAIVYGPRNEIVIRELDTTKSGPVNDTDSFPSQASQNAKGVLHDTDEAEVRVTWEDADLPTNRMVESTFEFRNTPDDDSGCKSVLRLFPLFVRVSCRDMTGRAEPETEISKKRLARLCVDEWMPIVR